MDSTHWPAGIGVAKSMEEKKPRPEKAQALNCPRCNSTHTKFCYYNNYSLTQPRYFCKTCRRYWTEGGTMRNVPVGGGSRKNKRPSSSSAPSKKVPDGHVAVTPPSFSQNPKQFLEGQDLNLAYAPNSGGVPANVVHDLAGNIAYNGQDSKNFYPSTASPQFSSVEFLKSGVASTGILNPFMSVPLTTPISDSMIFSSASTLPFQEFKPSLNFSLDGFDSGYSGNLQGVQEGNAGTSARLFFPFEELKAASSNSGPGIEQNRAQGDSGAFWSVTGFSGGSW